MTKVEWILTIIAIGLGVAMIISSILHVLREREIKQTRRAYWKHRDANILLEEKYATLEAANMQYAETVVELNEEIRRLQKSADHATVPLVEATPAKRTRKKAVN